MMKYCTCDRCIKNESIKNPYPLFERAMFLSEAALNFDFRTAALCAFGCKKFGKKPTCPPNIPGIDQYTKMFSDYRNIYTIGRKYPYSDGLFQSHWRNYSTNEIHDLLLQKERELFRTGHVYAKAFIGGSCKVCPSENCDPNKCRIPARGRVPIEATGLHVFSFLKALGQEYQEPPRDFFWRIGLVFY